jgi:hypothetical protein
VLLVAIAVGISFVVDAIEERNATSTASLIVMNYTDVDVHASVTPDGKPVDSGYGAAYSIGPRAGGAGANCCIELPTHWRPGIRVKVKYRFGDWPGNRYEEQTVELPRPPGDRPGDVRLSFLPDRSIELFDTTYSPGHPRWPGRMKDFPQALLDEGSLEGKR